MSVVRGPRGYEGGRDLLNRSFIGLCLSSGTLRDGHHQEKAKEKSFHGSSKSVMTLPLNCIPSLVGSSKVGFRQLRFSVVAREPVGSLSGRLGKDSSSEGR